MNPLFSLKDKVALVTGAAGLLGREHSKALVQAGATVVMVDLNEQALGGALTAVGSSEKLLHFVCDITKESEVLALSETLKSRGLFVSILVNNAARNPSVGSGGLESLERLESLDLNHLQLDFDVGIRGAVICTKVFGTQMAKRGNGSIINIASDLGVIAPNQNLYAEEGKDFFQQKVKPVGYSIVKHGLVGFTKYVATYWAQRGVRCNALSPGGVQTNQDSAFVQRVSELIPMGRMAQPKDYHGALVFLASDASSYMTGANLVVDGGRTVW